MLALHTCIYCKSAAYHITACLGYK